MLTQGLTELEHHILSRRADATSTALVEGATEHNILLMLVLMIQTQYISLKSTLPIGLSSPILFTFII